MISMFTYNTYYMSLIVFGLARWAGLVYDMSAHLFREATLLQDLSCVHMLSVGTHTLRAIGGENTNY